ncbi:MAG: hypothetical protein A2X49_03130 [Lentisphaerae bacterium GWF2_52_8]|nr:MAG: hypothetical protein A2X49_03130 [Lentisphaerae bacterium GWF2_52_8]
MKGKAPGRVPIAITVCANDRNAPGAELLLKVVDYLKSNKLSDRVELDAAFSSKKAASARPCVSIGEEVLDNCSFESVKKAIQHALSEE